MAIYLQCEEDKLRNLLVRTEMVLYENKKSLDGYGSGLSENVRKQTEAIYTVLSNTLIEELTSDAEMITGDWYLYDNAAAEGIKRAPGKLMALAAYSLAMLHEIGLHGLLIHARNDILVGVWLYKDYDYEAPIIRSQELIDEAYDKGGMLLSFSCTAMLLDKSFSEAVSDGCRLLKDYIYAVDINLENKDVPGSIYRSFEKEDNENTEPAEFAELAGLGINFSEPDDSYVEMNPIMLAFQNGYKAEKEQKEKQTPEPLDMRGYHSPVSKEVSSAVSAMNASSMGIVKAAGKKKAQIFLESIYAYLANEKKLLVVSEEGMDPEIFDILQKNGLDRFVWFEKEKKDFHSHINSIAELSPRELSKKTKLLQKRYEENQSKLNQYLEMLERETVDGITLICLLEDASEAEESRFSASFSNAEKKTVFGSDLRKFFAGYVKAWKECCYTSPDGHACFDLTEFTQEKIDQLKEMVHTSEIVITRFLEKLNEYGYAIEKIYQPDGRESQKEYFKIVMSINDFMIACTDLQDGMDADELPEATAEEAQAVDEYRNYLEYRRIYEAAGNTIKFSQAASLDDETVEKLEEITNRLLKSDLDSVSIPIPRQMVKDSLDLEKLLRDNGIYTASESLKCKAGSDKNTVLEAVCEAFTQPELIRSFAGDDTYKGLYEFFGENISGHGYLFWLQRELVRYYTNLISRTGIGEKTREIINGIMDCMTKPGRTLTGHQKALLNQAAELFADYYTPFHDMEKEIFGFLNLSYKDFDRMFPDRMLMEFILEWKELLETDQQYDSYVHEKAAAERQYLGGIIKQIRQLGLTPETAQEEFNHFWLTGAAAFWVEQIGFDYMDYEMTAESLKNCEKQLKAEKNVELYNSLLAERQRIINEHSADQISGEENLIDVLKQDAEFFFTIYPVLIVKPQTAEQIAEASELMFDRVIVADGEMVPFNQMLCSIRKSENLTIITPEEMRREAEDDRESVGHRALRMDFPVIG